jgi:hypothetical protein
MARSSGYQSMMDTTISMESEKCNESCEISKIESSRHSKNKLPVQSVPITSKVVSLNPRDCEVIQYYVIIKFVSYLRHVGSFLRILWFPPAIKLQPRNDNTI